MSPKIQILIYFAMIGIIDIFIPVPITALILIYVLFQKPIWFRQWVDEIYRGR